MSDSHPAGRGAASPEGPTLSDVARVDAKAMPRVLQRIVRLAFRYPGLVILAMGCSLGSALASLTLPRLFGRSVDQAHHLLAGAAADPEVARHALWVSAGLIIAACYLSKDDTGGRIILCVIAGAFGAIAVVAARAIHRKPPLSWWLLVGLIPTVVGLILTLG